MKRTDMILPSITFDLFPWLTRTVAETRFKRNSKEKLQEKFL